LNGCQLPLRFKHEIDVAADVDVAVVEWMEEKAARDRGLL
jgi:hypothetical protein